ncbi:MBL fold metallo-hydrolase [Mycetocola miduiensis]|uniref:Glyoxylase, beta-lactamase superfamily II n=1 Tax=Mycetocola miduiensis TaxID=995034 RepID=A0A1I4YNK8_9MICO|nr:MBL fold metallo-hydrolase [Mycetocola miduiensis]SFN39602.1 Glyoxylase, beta-lactamase superfamily II [Mycetocola miduiensis]
MTTSTRKKSGGRATRKSGSGATLTRDVAPGIHRLEHAYTNCYLVEHEGAVTLVDAAFPSTWPHLLSALSEIGRSPSDVSALVLTHAHFDHVGFAARAVRELQVPVWVHAADRELAAHPYRYQRERTPFLYPLKYPRSTRVLAAMTAAGALTVKGVSDVRMLPSSGVIDVPGHPTVVFTPGHTRGHCALHLPDRDALLTGDALVTLDPYKGARGAQIIAGAATANSEQAMESLVPLAETGAMIVLPGHGEPWLAGIRAAVQSAKATGAT